MPVSADAKHLQINTARRTNFSLILPAKLRDIVAHAIGNMDIFPGNVDVLKKIFPHEAVIGLRVPRREADIFIQIESFHFAPIQFQLNQRPVKLKRSTARGQPQHRIRLRFYQARNDAGRDGGGGLSVWLNDNFHVQ